MLTLHNWGGTKARGAPDPDTLANTFDVIAIAVDYLQSGAYEAEESPPYDFGRFQALDALRALFFVHDGLKRGDIVFDAERIYATGGSGGGNVSQMVNKFAPRTFAAIIDCSGMARLSDDIAYGYAGGSTLNAGYATDPASPRYLPPDTQLVSDLTYLPHLEAMKRFGNQAKIIAIHGMDDTTCPFFDKRDMADLMSRAELDVETHFIGADQVDGDLFKDTGHSVGDRTKMVLHVARKYLDPDGPESRRRAGPTDFDLRDSVVRYAGPTATWIIGYEAGYPVLRVEPHHRHANGSGR